ncbi:hypothetical protein C8Q76DRAFT_348327 [Earliella scabrosa]|nr:hypothetical protein C8Q76DRAFT_348327 [Earliella scabrosa]
MHITTTQNRHSCSRISPISPFSPTPPHPIPRSRTHMSTVQRCSTTMLSNVHAVLTLHSHCSPVSACLSPSLPHHLRGSTHVYSPSPTTGKELNHGWVVGPGVSPTDIICI